MKGFWLLLVLGELCIARPALAAGPADCPHPRADLGIHYRFTAGEFLDAEDGSLWLRFLTEPRVTTVTPGKPADGRLEVGDTIVSVDGHLVTTETGSHSFHFASGKSMELVVRRRGQLQSVRLTPVPNCGDDDSVEASSTGEPPSGAARPNLGIHFRCTDCGLDRIDGENRWRFGNRPEIISVVPGSPADVAGLRAGDLLVAIDGLDATTPEGGRRFSELRPGVQVHLAFERDGVPQEITLVVGGDR